MCCVSGEIFEKSVENKEGIQEKLQIKLAGDAHSQRDFLGWHVLMGLQEFGNHFVIRLKLGLILVHISFLLGGTNHKTIPIMKPKNKKNIKRLSMVWCPWYSLYHALDSIEIAKVINWLNWLAGSFACDCGTRRRLSR